MARRVIGGQVPESPGTLVQQTRDFDSPAKQIDDHNANYEEIFNALGLGSTGNLVTLALPAASYDDLDNSGGDFTGVSAIDFVASIVDTVVNGMRAGTEGQRIEGFCGGTMSVTFPLESTTSLGANRFMTVSPSFTAIPGDIFLLLYRAGRWRVG